LDAGGTPGAACHNDVREGALELLGGAHELRVYLWAHRYRYRHSLKYKYRYVLRHRLRRLKKKRYKQIL
jgi:hypothetical protein